jgi:hypothetical protein
LGPSDELQGRKPVLAKTARFAAVRYAKEGQIGLSSPTVRITSIHFDFDGFDDESADLVWSRPTSAGSGCPQGCRLERLVEFRVHTLLEFLVGVWIAATFDKCNRPRRAWWLLFEDYPKPGRSLPGRGQGRSQTTRSSWSPGRPKLSMRWVKTVGSLERSPACRCAIASRTRVWVADRLVGFCEELDCLLGCRDGYVRVSPVGFGPCH